jgi:hypothetical protein
MTPQRNLKMRVNKPRLVCFILLLIPLIAYGDRINLSQTNGESFWPALAVNPDGVLMAIFTEAVEGANDIYMALSYDGGNSWTTPQRTYSRTQFIKAVALDADKYGNFHMCYSDGWGSGGREIYYRYYVNGSWQAAEQLSFSNDNSNWCRISADGDEVHVIWYQEIGWPIKPYIALKSKAIGGAWPANTVDVSRDPNNGGVSPDVKAKDGNIYAVYRVQVYSGDALLGKHISFSERLNGTWYGPTEIGYFNLPDVDVDEYGNVHCVMTNGGLVEYRAKVNGVWQATEWLNDWGAIVSFFDIKYGFNNLIAAYMMSNGNGDRYSIYYSRKTYNGIWGAWGAPIELDPGIYAEFPKLAIDKNGKVHIIWADVGNGGEMDIYYTSLSLPSQDKPAIQIDKASLTFLHSNNAPSPVPQVLLIRNSGSGTLNYQVSKSTDWLNVTPASGSSAGEWDNISVSVNYPGVLTNTQTGTITVTSPDSSNSPQTVTVFLKKLGPTIELSKTSLSFTAIFRENNPEPKEFSIKNSGSDSLNYQIFSSRNWLSVSPSQGSSSGEWDTIRANVDSSSLGLGNYEGTLTVQSSNATNSPRNIPVYLWVKKPDLPYAPINVRGQMIDNEGLFIKVYISRITWDKNPKNFDIYDITKFKIYRKLSSQPEGSFVLLGEVPASGALEYEDEFSTWEDRDKHVYAVTSMSIEGRESEKAAAFFSTSSPKANMSLNSVQKRLIRK